MRQSVHETARDIDLDALYTRVAEREASTAETLGISSWPELRLFAERAEGAFFDAPSHDSLTRWNATLRALCRFARDPSLYPNFDQVWFYSSLYKHYYATSLFESDADQVVLLLIDKVIDGHSRIHLEDEVNQRLDRRPPVAEKGR